jgi:hypothetical protein
VDKGRYDGQVRKVNETVEENTRLKDQIARLQGQAPPPPQAPPPAPDGDLTTDQMVRMMFEDYANRATTTLLDGVLAKYPEAAPFKDFIGGSTPDEVEASAKSLHERALVLKGGDPNAASPPPEGGATGTPPAAPSGQQPPAPGTTTTVVPGGSPPAGDQGPSLEDQLREALRTRNMGEYTRLKRENPDLKVRQPLTGQTNYRQQ